MPAPTVFYAWQSDLPADECRSFIRNAALEAIERLSDEVSIEDSPRLDHDTEGVAGIPGIGDTIMRKISGCAAFIGDVSLCGTSIDRSGKRLFPNPNVLIELGYAWGRLDWRRLILVMNTKNGQPIKLPFDLRHRRFPFTYRIKADKSNAGAEQGRLTDYLRMAIKAILDEEYQLVKDTIRKLDGSSMHVLQSNSSNSHFWETDPGKNSLAVSHHLAMVRLVELGVFELTTLPNTPTGYAYTWTYLGKQIRRYLGMPGFVARTNEFANVAPTVVTDFSMLDDISKEQGPESEKTHDGV